MRQQAVDNSYAIPQRNNVSAAANRTPKLLHVQGGSVGGEVGRLVQLNP